MPAMAIEAGTGSAARSPEPPAWIAAIPEPCRMRLPQHNNSRKPSDRLLCDLGVPREVELSSPDRPARFIHGSQKEIAGQRWLPGVGRGCGPGGGQAQIK